MSGRSNLGPVLGVPSKRKSRHPAKREGQSTGDKHAESIKHKKLQENTRTELNTKRWNYRAKPHYAESSKPYLAQIFWAFLLDRQKSINALASSACSEPSATAPGYTMGLCESSGHTKASSMPS